MPYFSNKSKGKLLSCDMRLQKICNQAILIVDFSVDSGWRNEVEQMAAFNANPQRSHLPWPKSKHNKAPCEAVDLAPYPSRYESIREFYKLAGVMFAVAYNLEIEIMWGGNWKSLKDYPHFELKEE